MVVTLPENGTTGYRWPVRRVEGDLEVADSTAVPPRETVPGAGGTRVLGARPTEAGDGRPELHLKRPWGDDVAERYTLRVTA
jgi:predicted secreted protein